jgi:hypothetical protein
MADLQRILEKIKQDDIKVLSFLTLFSDTQTGITQKKKKNYRKFIVVEGLYLNTGEIVNLPALVPSAVFQTFINVQNRSS